MENLSVKERQLQVREEAILDGGEELMAAVGYDAMTMEDLAARVGVSKATLYCHFHSKEDLAIHVLIRMVRRSEEFVARQGAALPAIERLEQVVRWVIERRFGEGSTLLGAARPSITPLLNHHPAYCERKAALVAALSRLVDDAKRDGDVSESLPTRAIVQVLFSLVRDAEYEVLLASGECSAMDLSTTLVSLIFDGIRRKKN